MGLIWTKQKGIWPFYYSLRPTLADWKDAIEQHMTGEGLTRGTNSVPRYLRINSWDLTRGTKYFLVPRDFPKQGPYVFLKNIE